MWCVTVCHEYIDHRRTWDREAETTDEDEEETPSFLNEESAEDLEVLTDGGE